jgi:hypothetical protein
MQRHVVIGSVEGWIVWIVRVVDPEHNGWLRDANAVDLPKYECCGRY